MIWWDYLFEIFTNTTTLHSDHELNFQEWEVGEVTFEVILRVFVDIGQKCRGRPKIAQQSYVIHRNLANNINLGSTATASKQENWTKSSLLKLSLSVKLFSLWRNQRHGRGRQTEIACLKYFGCRENVIYGKTFRDF